MLRFDFATPLLLAAALCWVPVDTGKCARLAAGERFGQGFAGFPIGGVSSLGAIRIPEFPGCYRAIWPNFTEEYDSRPYFVRYPVTHYGYRTLISNGRFLYRSDVARLWPPGRLAFYAAQRPWFWFSPDHAMPLTRSSVTPHEHLSIVTPPRHAVPILVLNPFAERATTEERDEAGNMSKAGDRTAVVRWENSEAVRPLRITNPHVVGAK